jgi:hypothetical protein
MRKLTSILDTRYSILLFLLIILTFSNCVFAESANTPKRCKVEYTQLDLITGTETIYKETSQFEYLDECKKGLEKLAPKVYKWVDENNTNIISKINEFKCKTKNNYYKNFPFFSYEWGRYRDCETYKQKLSVYLVNKYPNQIGASIYKEFNSIEVPIVD